MSVLFNTCLVLYLLAMVVAIIGLVSKKKTVEKASNVLILCGVLAQTGYIVWRWVAAERAPFSNMFESLFLFAWTVAVFYLLFRAKRNVPALGAGAALAAALAIASATAFFAHGADIKPLIPALQSNWLTVHVFTCFLGYGGFALSFVAALIYLVGGRKGGSMSQESLADTEELVARSTSFGFLLLTVGIITGAVWANSAWGTYWSWDPKETWSLITWFVYAFYLHCRFMRGWRGRAAAWIAVLGFVSVLFTYFGVNFLMSGLHSYG